MTPLENASYDIGANGSEPTEEDRLAFEAWMRGHCWTTVGDWDGKQYKHKDESNGRVHGGAMETRRLWAAWRDRGAVARVLAEQAQAVEPANISWRPLVLWYEAGANDWDTLQCIVTKMLHTHPAPPDTGERAELIAAIKHELAEFAHNKVMETLLLDSVDMLEADAQQRSKPHGHCTHPKCRDIWSAYLEATEKLSKYEPGAVMHLNNLQQVAVPERTLRDRCNKGNLCPWSDEGVDGRSYCLCCGAKSQGSGQ